MIAFKVFLALFIVIQGQDKPFQEAIEVPSVNECLEQQRKLLAQPMPRNVLQLQTACVLVRDGEPA